MLEYFFFCCWYFLKCMPYNIRHNTNLNTLLGHRVIFFLYLHQEFVLNIRIQTCTLNIREAAKKSSFLSGPATKTFSPPPPRLSSNRNFFSYIKNYLFSLVDTRLAPPPLSGPATKKITFFAASL